MAEVTISLSFWLNQIAKIKDMKQFKNFKKKYKKDMEMFSGTDAQAINEAIFNKEESFKK